MPHGGFLLQPTSSRLRGKPSSSVGREVSVAPGNPADHLSNSEAEVKCHGSKVAHVMKDSKASEGQKKL